MKIHYETEDRDLKAKPGDNLLKICLKNKVPINHTCEGMASCGTCRVIVTSDLQTLPKRNFLEQDMAEDRNFARHERLACQMDLEEDLTFKLPED